MRHDDLETEEIHAEFRWRSVFGVSLVESIERGITLMWSNRRERGGVQWWPLMNMLVKPQISSEGRRILLHGVLSLCKKQISVIKPFVPTAVAQNAM